MICPNCRCEDVDIRVVEERKSGGCFMVLLYIILAITILGWLILIPLILSKKTRTVTYAVCKKCGRRWEVTGRDMAAAKAQQQNIQYQQKQVAQKQSVQSLPSQIVEKSEPTSKKYAYSAIPEEVDLNADVKINKYNVGKNDSGDLCLNVNLLNKTNKKITAIKFEATATNTFGDDISVNGSNTFELISQDINLLPDSMIDIRPISLPDESIRNIKLKVKQFVCDSGEVMIPAEPYYVKTKQNPMTDEQIAYVSTKNSNAKYMYSRTQEYWQCVCGMINKNDSIKCKFCDSAKGEVEYWSIENINDNIEKSKIRDRQDAVDLQNKKDFDLDKTLSMVGFGLSIIGLLLGCCGGFGALLGIAGVGLSVFVFVKNQDWNKVWKILGMAIGGLAILWGLICFLIYTIPSDSTSSSNSTNSGEPIIEQQDTTSDVQ